MCGCFRFKLYPYVHSSEGFLIMKKKNSYRISLNIFALLHDIDVVFLANGYRLLAITKSMIKVFTSDILYLLLLSTSCLVPEFLLYSTKNVKITHWNSDIEHCFHVYKGTFFLMYPMCIMLMLYSCAPYVYQNSSSLCHGQWIILFSSDCIIYCNLYLCWTYI